jgi:hypothetical protein
MFARVSTATSLLAVTMVAASALCGCSSTKTTATRACRPAHAPTYPTTDASLGSADNGGTWCVTVGETLVVSLSVPFAEAASRWQSATPSDTTILEPVSNGAVSLVRGVTATFLAVRKPGVVTVTATRPGHPPWKATVVARDK